MGCSPSWSWQRLLWLPYVTWLYRRYGRVSPRRVIAQGAFLLYLLCDLLCDAILRTRVEVDADLHSSGSTGKEL